MNTTRKSAALAIILFASCSIAGPLAHDGEWWEGLPRDERLGFLAGYLDFATFDAGLANLGHVSWAAAEKGVSDYYLDHPTQKATRVVEALMRVVPALIDSSGPGQGQEVNEKHGIFDGEYWRQASAAHRRGFLNGYLEGRRSTQGVTGKADADIEGYLAAVSNWYGVRSDDPSEIRGDRVDAKIADVLRGLEKGETP